MADIKRGTLVLAVAGLTLLAALLLLRRDDGLERGGEPSLTETTSSGAETPGAGKKTRSAKPGTASRKRWA